MARRPRLIIENQPHHIVQRGHNRAAVFFEDNDYVHYRECLRLAAERYGCSIHAYCLMTNHIHLLVTPEKPENLSRMMQMVGRQYVRYVNARLSRSGALWEDRFKVSLVDAEDYLLSCMRYIELNPVRARMVRKAENYKWSSVMANAHAEADGLITSHAVYRSLGETWEERARDYRDFIGRAVAQDDLNLIRASIQGNWVLGSDKFRDRMERKTGISAAPTPRGGDRRSEKFLKGARKRAA